MLKKYVFTIAFISWMVFVTFSSLYSFEYDGDSTFKIPHFDKVIHFTFYFVACVLGMLFLRERTKGTIHFGKALFFITITTIGFGILMEVLQHHLTTERSGDLFDGLANTIGSFCGAMLTKFYFSSNRIVKLKKRRLKWKF